MDSDQELALRYGVFRNRDADRYGIGRQRGGQPKGHPMVRGISSVVPEPWTVGARLTCAVLAGPDGSLLFGDAGLEAFGALSLRAQGLVTVNVGRNSRAQSRGFVSFERSSHAEAASTTARRRLVVPLEDGIGIASPASLVVRAAEGRGGQELLGIATKLVQRKALTPQELSDFVERHRRSPGAAKASWVAGQLGEGAQSAGEAQLLAWAAASGLPAAGGQVPIWSGDTLVSTTDAFWDDGVAGYFDGLPHLEFENHKRDVRIRKRLRTAGLVVLEVVSDDYARPKVLARDLRSCLDEARRAAERRRWSRTARGIDLMPGY